VHNTLGFPRSLFEVLVCFGPGDNRELLAAVGLRYYRAYKEVASLRTEAPETPTLQRAISTQSKIQISRREEQLILGPTRACARVAETLTFLTFLDFACTLAARTRCDDDDFVPPPPRATFAPSSHRDATDAWASSGRRSEPSSELLHPTREGPPLSPHARGASPIPDRCATLLEAPGRALALSRGEAELAHSV
jgi:hypothetical protein